MWDKYISENMKAEKVTREQFGTRIQGGYFIDQVNNDSCSGETRGPFRNNPDSKN